MMNRQFFLIIFLLFCPIFLDADEIDNYAFYSDFKILSSELNTTYPYLGGICGVDEINFKVTCDGSGRYTSIIFRDIPINASFPDTIGNLSESLKHLEVTNCGMESTVGIASLLESLPNLEYFNISHNDWEEEILGLSSYPTNLSVFDVSFNEISGTLPTEPSGVDRYLQSNLFECQDPQVPGFTDAAAINATCEECESRYYSCGLNGVCNLKGQCICDGSPSTFVEPDSLTYCVNDLANLRRIFENDPNTSTVVWPTYCSNLLTIFFDGSTTLDLSLVCNKGPNKIKSFYCASQNSPSKTIPTEFSFFYNMDSFTIYGNRKSKLFGTIPTELSLLKQVSIFQLRSLPMLTGTIPSVIANMPTLRGLQFQELPKIGGTLPNEIRNNGNNPLLRSLEIFDIPGIYGSIPRNYFNLTGDPSFYTGQPAYFLISRTSISYVDFDYLITEFTNIWMGIDIGSNLISNEPTIPFISPRAYTLSLRNNTLSCNNTFIAQDAAIYATIAMRCGNSAPFCNRLMGRPDTLASNLKRCSCVPGITVDDRGHRCISNVEDYGKLERFIKRRKSNFNFNVWPFSQGFCGVEGVFNAGMEILCNENGRIISLISDFPVFDANVEGDLIADDFFFPKLQRLHLQNGRHKGEFDLLPLGNGSLPDFAELILVNLQTQTSFNVTGLDQLLMSYGDKMKTVYIESIPGASLQYNLPTLPGTPYPFNTGGVNLTTLGLSNLTLSGNFYPELFPVKNSLTILKLSHLQVSGDIEDIISNLVSYDDAQVDLSFSTFSGLIFPNNQIFRNFFFSSLRLQNTLLSCPIPDYSLISTIDDYATWAIAGTCADFESCPTVNDCSGRGSCINSTHCNCLPCYEGIRCETYNVSTCIHCSAEVINSTCGQFKEAQGCESGSCSSTSDICNNNGVFRLGACRCFLGFSGANCNYPLWAGTGCPLPSLIEFNEIPETLITVTTYTLEPTGIRIAFVIDNYEKRFLRYVVLKGKNSTVGEIESNSDGHCYFPSNVNQDFTLRYSSSLCKPEMTIFVSYSKLTNDCQLDIISTSNGLTVVSGRIEFELVDSIEIPIPTRKRANEEIYFMTTGGFGIYMELPRSISITVSSITFYAPISVTGQIFKKTFSIIDDSLEIWIITFVTSPNVLGNPNIVEGIGAETQDVTFIGIENTNCYTGTTTYPGLSCSQITKFKISQVAIAGCIIEGSINVTWPYTCPHPQNPCAPTDNYEVMLSFSILPSDICDFISQAPQLEIAGTIENEDDTLENEEGVFKAFSENRILTFRVTINSPIEQTVPELFSLNLTYYHLNTGIRDPQTEKIVRIYQKDLLSRSEFQPVIINVINSTSTEFILNFTTTVSKIPDQAIFYEPDIRNFNYYIFFDLTAEFSLEYDLGGKKRKRKRDDNQNEIVYTISSFSSSKSNTFNSEIVLFVLEEANEGLTQTQTYLLVFGCLILSFTPLVFYIVILFWLPVIKRKMKH